MIPIIGVGAGGHASVMVALARSHGFQTMALWAACHGEGYSSRLPYPLYDDEKTLRSLAEFAFIGFGSTNQATMRARVVMYTALRDNDFIVPSLIDKTACVARGTFYGYGVAIMARATIQPHVRLGMNVLINTGAIIEHGCKIGDHVHVASGAILGGDVTVGDASHIGLGAVIRQGITIGNAVCVGAGAVVVKDVPDGTTVIGNPARRLHEHHSAV